MNFARHGRWTWNDALAWIFVITMFHKFEDFDGLALFIRIVQAGGLARPNVRQAYPRQRSPVGYRRWKRL
jgi:hypothetical protein